MQEKKYERCKKCGFRVKGKKHDEGEHHQKGSNAKYTPPRRSKR